MLHSPSDIKDSSFSDDIKKLLNFILRNFWTVSFSVVTFLVLGIAYLWLATPKFVSTAEILIDPRPRQQVEDGAAPTGLGSSAVGADIALVQSQVGVIKSRSALLTLIEEFDLLIDYEFGNANGAPNQIINIIKSVVYGPSYAKRGTKSPTDRALQELNKAIEVKRAGNTYIVSVRVETESPQKSSQLANALVAIYQRHLQSTAGQSNAETASAMEAPPFYHVRRRMIWDLSWRL